MNIDLFILWFSIIFYTITCQSMNNLSYHSVTKHPEIIFSGSVYGCDRFLIIRFQRMFFKIIYLNDKAQKIIWFDPFLGCNYLISFRFVDLLINSKNKNFMIFKMLHHLFLIEFNLSSSCQWPLSVLTK